MNVKGINLYGMYALSVSIMAIGAYLYSLGLSGNSLIGFGVFVAIIGIITDIISKHNYYLLAQHRTHYAR